MLIDKVRDKMLFCAFQIFRGLSILINIKVLQNSEYKKDYSVLDLSKATLKKDRWSSITILKKGCKRSQIKTFR